MISGKPPEAAFASAPAIQCHTSQDGNHRLPVPDERVQTNGLRKSVTLQNLELPLPPCGPNEVLFLVARLFKSSTAPLARIPSCRTQMIYIIAK